MKSCSKHKRLRGLVGLLNLPQWLTFEEKQPITLTKSIFSFILIIFITRPQRIFKQSLCNLTNFMTFSYLTKFCYHIKEQHRHIQNLSNISKIKRFAKIVMGFFNILKNSGKWTNLTDLLQQK